MSMLDFLKPPAARIPGPPAELPEFRETPAPPSVAIPLEYPDQRYLKPTVEAGETVSRGQVVGRSEDGSRIHASVGGVVREIGRTWCARGRHVPALVIDRDETPALSSGEILDREGVDPMSAKRVELLEAGGVISPWSVPTHEREEHPDAEPPELHTVVLLGYDQEPGQRLQALLLQDHVGDLVEGAQIVHEVAPQARVVLAVDARDAAAVAAVVEENFEIVAVPARYDRRLVRVVVRDLTGLDVPAEVSPRSAGVGVLTVENALAAMASLSGRPCLDKAVVVSGLGLERPVATRVPLGTSVRHVLESCGADLDGAERLLAGGVMGGRALQNAETPVDKFLHALHVQGAGETPAGEFRSCVGCGRCVQVCPADLQVHMIGRCVEFDQFEAARELHPEACLECGLCAFVCPAHRPLQQMVELAATDQRRVL